MRRGHEYFVRAKAWLLLLLILSPVLLFVSLTVSAAPVNLGEHAIQLLMLVATILFNILYFIWIWSIGYRLMEIATDLHQLGKIIFSISTVFVFIFLPVFGLSAIYADLPEILELFLTLLSTIAVVSMLYMLVYVSCAIVAFESRTTQSHGSCFGTFLSLWFFPVGIWFAQPRVNNLYKTHK